MITQIRKYTNTNCLKDPTCALFLKSIGFKDIKYDIPCIKSEIHKHTNTQIHKYTNTQIHKIHHPMASTVRTLFVAFIERIITFLFLQHMDALELLMAGNF